MLILNIVNLSLVQWIKSCQSIIAVVIVKTIVASVIDYTTYIK